MGIGTKLVYKAPQESQSSFNIGCLCLVDKAPKWESDQLHVLFPAGGTTHSFLYYTLAIL